RGRGDAEMRHAVTLDEGPHSRRVGEIRCPVVQDDCRAEHKPARDEPRTHHPADIGRPEDHVALLEVEAVREILRGLYWKPTAHSTVNGRKTATRSPCFTPRERSPAAKLAT